VIAPAPNGAWRVAALRLAVVLVLVLAVGLVWLNSAAAVRAADKMVYLSTVRAMAATYKLPPATVLAVMLVESSFNPRARSAAGAVGLMQVMPVTAREIGAVLGFRPGDIDLEEPETNIRFGCYYLAELEKQCGSLDRALQAYNGGPATLRGLATGDTHPYAETRQFVERVQRWHWRFTRLLQAWALLRGEELA